MGKIYIELSYCKNKRIDFVSILECHNFYLTKIAKQFFLCYNIHIRVIILKEIRYYDRTNLYYVKT